MYKKVTTTTTEEYSDMPLNDMSNGNGTAKMYIHCIRVDAPLMIRLLEYAREDSMSDIDLHKIVEKMMEESSDGSVLTMEDYEDLIPPKEPVATIPETM